MRIISLIVSLPAHLDRSLLPAPAMMVHMSHSFPFFLSCLFWQQNKPDSFVRPVRTPADEETPVQRFLLMKKREKRHPLSRD